MAPPRPHRPPIDLDEFRTFYSRAKSMKIYNGDQLPLEISVGESVFVMPPPEEYKRNEHFKRRGKIPGDIYWQAKIVKLGIRKEDVDSDNVAVDVPKAVVVIDWYYTYYDIVSLIDKNVVKSWGISNLGHLERVLSNHRQVILPDEICDLTLPKCFDDTTASMPLMDKDDYFVRKGTLTWTDAAVTFERNGNVCYESCIKNGVYDPSDVGCELRWCGYCNKWFHSCCADEEAVLNNTEDLQQSYLLEDGLDLFSRIISRPICRVSRKHNAPLSLEKIQRHLIGKWKSGVRFIADSDMVESDVFGGEVNDDWENTIETSLELMGDWKWMTCPSCLSSYI